MIREPRRRKRSLYVTSSFVVLREVHACALPVREQTHVRRRRRRRRVFVPILLSYAGSSRAGVREDPTPTMIGNLTGLTNISAW